MTKGNYKLEEVYMKGNNKLREDSFHVT
uniref:Uncharacterized protein n=1 Tax=Vitis vinifera TaxID=29760 RepID=F6GVC1_VITVI